MKYPINSVVQIVVNERPCWRRIGRIIFQKESDGAPFVGVQIQLWPSTVPLILAFNLDEIQPY